MGWVMISERELNRIEVLAHVDDGRLSVQSGANMLDVTKRQMFRLLKRYRLSILRRLLCFRFANKIMRNAP